MADFLKLYGACEGPLGFPMTDAAAQAVDAVLRSLPREPAYDFRRLSVGQGLSELQAGERADVSWITEQSIDRDGDVVLAAGMDDRQFALNPIVTLNHAYWQPPVGKSIWRKRVKEGERRGIKAKTHYPPRPAAWPAADAWLPDYAYELVKADLLRGKSIGFLPTRVRSPTEEDVRRRPEWSKVRHVVEEWLLLEYACCVLPAQPNAVVEAVSKSALPADVARALGPPDEPVIPFTPLDEIERAWQRRLASINLSEFIRKKTQLAFDKARGRV